jgi:ribosomal protein RSM22 (predicted rRNA methylase)
VRRVVGEVAVRLPGFKPKLMLDYGAGPGTAAWAAQEVSSGNSVEELVLGTRFGRLRLAYRIQTCTELY